MQMLATGNPMQSLKVTDPQSLTDDDAGFSLTELMIVVFIIGVVSSFILMTAPRTSSDVERKADDLVQTLSSASELAVISGVSHGIDIGVSELTVVHLVSGKWMPLPQARVTIPQNMVLSVEGVDVDQAQWVPEIVLDPIGSATPARLRFEGSGGALDVTIDAGTNVSLEESFAR